MPDRTVLISGASIAGPALAFWLHRYGMRAVVVERAPELRPGGQTVDLRGAGRIVARRMGVEDDVRKVLTHEKGVAFVDAAGRPRAEVGVAAFGGEGLVAELEVLRGDLSAVLYEHTRQDTEYVFGDRITALDDAGDRVRVTLQHGGEREADIVVGADGIRSSTRRLVFGDQAVLRPLGQYMSYFTIPGAASDGDWARWYSAPGSRTVLLRPDNQGTTKAALSFLSPPRGYERLGADAQKTILEHVFAGAGWEAERVVRAMADTKDFYFEATGQVRMPTWSRGRVALLGDAGYCASPISGMGTSLALVGAYVLAGELAGHADHRAAFAAYERVLRPYVDRAQKLPPGAPRIGSPRTGYGIRFQHAVIRLATSDVVGRVTGRMFSTPADGIELPDYSRHAVAG